MKYFNQIFLVNSLLNIVLVALVTIVLTLVVQNNRLVQQNQTIIKTNQAILNADKKLDEEIYSLKKNQIEADKTFYSDINEIKDLLKSK